MAFPKPAPLHPAGLLARHRGDDCYRDAFRFKVPGTITLEAFLLAFYSSVAFWPERLALAAIGRAGSSDVLTELAAGRTTGFAAWTIEAREENQILLADFLDETCSWLMIEPVVDRAATVLWFGTAVRRKQDWLVRALTPAHRLYSRLLLAGAARKLR